MRPIKLTLQAIGPFKNKVEIDFSEIGEHELFLIHGKTGSGKTTLFDAICYALYGTVPSGREGVLKSDYASETDKPFIEFEFALGNDRYCVCRQFAYSVPKKNGEGLRGSSEKLQFNRVLEEGRSETLATKKTAILEAVQERLGLDVNQFSQVVLLPQGEFRQLLLANSKDREALLEKLFDTSFYADIEAWFEEESSRFATENRSVQEKRQTLLEQACDMIPPERRPSEEAVFGVETIDEEIGLLNVRIKSDETDVSKLTKASEEKLKKLQAAQQLMKDIADLKSRKADQDALEELKDEMSELCSEFKVAQEAAPLIPELDEIDRQGLFAKKNEKALDDAIEAHRVAETRKKETDQASKEIPKLEKSTVDLGAMKEQLAKLRHTVESLGEHYVKQEETADEIAEAEEGCKSSTRQLADLGQLLKTKKDASEKLKESEIDAEVLRKRLEQLEEALAARKKNETQSLELKELKTTKASAVRKRSASEETLVALRERRERNLAGELAQTLEDGTACPVCGSQEHPQPAALADETATLEAIQGAEQNLRRADFAVNEIATEVEKSEAVLQLSKDRLNALENDLGETADVKSVDSINAQLKAEKERTLLLQQVESEIDDLEREQIPHVKIELSKYETAKKSATHTQKKISKEVERLERLFEEQCVPNIAERFESDEVSVDDIDDLIFTVTEEADGLKEQVDTIKQDIATANEKLAGAESTLNAAKTSSKEAQDALKKLNKSIATKIEASSFESIELVKSAYKSSEWQEKSATRIREYDQNVLSVAALIKDLTKRISGEEPPEIETLQEAYEKQRLDAEHAVEALHALKNNQQSLQKLGDRVRELEKSFEAIAARMKVLGRIDEQVRGKGNPKISLKRFFLAQRLEEVLIQASNRLRVLSDGRFDLKRDPNVSDARSGAGLDLLVSDSFTGTERPVNSLSGGQMFLASLSMALGLADVVQARSGGIRLDTLFVDEGFGSLDDETLQVALKVLNELREGRMVCVISHVSELKRQIANRIEVMAAEVGSTVKMTLA